MRCSIAIFGILAALVLTTPTFGQTGSIGLYTDESGSTCSFSGNDPGFIKAYVVSRPGTDGLRVINFAAPVPACLGAVYLGDEPSTDFVTVGNSQVGMSMTAGSCASGVTHVLTINYFRNASTTPCCEYSITPVPGESAITGTNCAQHDITLSSRSGHFNADASCECVGGYSPSQPFNPAPAHQAGAASVFTALSWSALDLDNDLVDYDVFLGTNPSPPLAAAHITNTTFQPAQLDPLTQYFWRVVARDALGNETSGPVWSFTTRVVSSPPDPPSDARPFDGTFSAAVTAWLSWTGNDVDGDLVDYDVYFGTETEPPLLATHVVGATYQPGTLEELTFYYWRVVARDALGNETSGPIWSFRTRLTNSPPSMPTPVFPTNGGTFTFDNPTLRWDCGDIDGDPLTYNVYFGTTLNPPLVASGLSVKSYQPGILAVGTYYWRVVANDPYGNQNSAEDVWTFTRLTPPYVRLYGPDPLNLQTGVPLGGALSWHVDSTYPFPLTYDVYFGQFGDPNLVPVATNLPTPYYMPPGGVQNGAEWFVVARGNTGSGTLTAYGPPWYFSTQPIQPNTPSNPSPAYLGTSTVTPTLSWSVTNPNGQSLTYRVRFATGDGEGPLPEVAIVSQPSYQVGPLEPGRRYYWGVTACGTQYCTAGPDWTFVAEGPLPVLFSQFSASPARDGVQVSWALSADEALSDYTLFRREHETTRWTAMATNSLASTSGSYLDRDVARGKTYEYQMVVRAAGGDQFSSPTVSVELPGLELSLGRNHPNPFNPQTVIPYSLPTRGPVRMAIYDAKGGLVRVLVDEQQEAGPHEVTWNGQDRAGRTASSGVYFCVLESAKERRTQKMVLLK